MQFVDVIGAILSVIALLLGGCCFLSWMLDLDEVEDE